MPNSKRTQIWNRKRTTTETVKEDVQFFEKSIKKRPEIRESLLILNEEHQSL